jgi:hypothetical protein
MHPFVWGSFPVSSFSNVKESELVSFKYLSPALVGQQIGRQALEINLLLIDRAVCSDL